MNIDRRKKPDLLFTTRTSLSFEEVEQAYAEGAVEAFESVKLIGKSCCMSLPLRTALLDVVLNPI